MPGRANLMSPAQMYDMAPSRWSTLSKILNNKKAMDAAFMKHQWEMQRQAADMAAGERRQHIAGQYGLKQQEMANDKNSRSYMDEAMMNQAMKYALDRRIDLNTPEGQQAFRNIYQTLLSSQKPGEMPKGELPDMTTGVRVGSMSGTKGLPDKVMVTSPDGQKGYIPREKVREALKRGFKIG